MTRSLRFFLSAAFAMLFLQTASADRVRQNFDFGWQFHLGEDTACINPAYNPASWQWQDVQIPHDWSIELQFDRNAGGASGFLPGGIGLYRKEFTVPASVRGRKVGIVFDGVYHKATVYLNGKKVGYHRYGFTSFEYDLTPYVNFGGGNVLLVHVDHSEVSRWYTGSGIYRHVWLLYTDPVRIAPWGTYVTTPSVASASLPALSAASATVSVETKVVNGGPVPVRFTVRQTIIDGSGRPVKNASAISAAASLAAGDSSVVKQSLSILSPHLWDVGDPYLYHVRTEVCRGGRVLDSSISPLGIRTFAFDADKGFSLNGRTLKLQGVCLHQDAGVLGTGVPHRSFERRLQILKSFGVNAIRCSHNPPAPEFLDLCDSLGFVVIDEAFDKWKSGYYADFFDSSWRQDIGDMLLRDRNHPSIVLWSIGNEVTEAWLKTDEGVQRAKMLQDFVHQAEPSRMCMLAAQNNFEDKFGEVTDVLGYNYMEPRMVKDHKTYPERCMIVTEAFPYYSGLHPSAIREYVPRNPWNFVRDNDFIAGSFIWAGAEYIGESEYWPSKGWSAAPFDMCMDEKPVAFFHRVLWNPDRPMLKMIVCDNVFDMDPGKDHWQYPCAMDTWDLPYPEDKMVEVLTVTTCDSVSLYTVSARKGITRFAKRATADYHDNAIVWNQPYRPGKIVAIGYKGGVEVCRDSLVTTRGSSALRLAPDRSVIRADGQDLSYIDVSLLDADGHFSRMDDKIITVTVEGPGRLRGIDSGDMRRAGSFAGNSLKTYFGKASIVVQSERRSGEITVNVVMEGRRDPYKTLIKVQ